MIKKIIFLLTVIINTALVQNTAFAEEQYAKDFYINNIRQKIERNWVVPINAKNKSAVVSFTVNPDGSISNVNVLRSSGDDAFDESAVYATYKPFPFRYSNDISEPINIQFFFSPVFTNAAVASNQPKSNIVNISNAIPFVDFSEYCENLQNKINANWKPKTLAKEKSAIATVEITKDGSLSNLYIVKSSRDNKFDRDIIDAISKSVPMDAFPNRVNAPKTDVQLTFTYSKMKLDTAMDTKTHYVNAQLMNIKGYDKYTKLVEKVLEDRLKGKRYFFHKDLILELEINKTGKLKYAKIKTPSGDKNFDRKMLAIIQQTSFPPVPDTIPFNDVTLNYEIITQRGQTFHDFIFDYLIYNCTTGLKPFSLSKQHY